MVNGGHLYGGMFGVILATSGEASDEKSCYFNNFWWS